MREPDFKEKAAGNKEFMRIAEMLFYLPPDQQQFFYETIEAFYLKEQEKRKHRSGFKIVK